MRTLWPFGAALTTGITGGTLAGSFTGLAVGSDSRTALTALETSTGTVGAVGMGSPSGTVAGHDFMVLGLNLRPGEVDGVERIDFTDTAWAWVLEKNYPDSRGSVINEFYLTPQGAERVFQGGYATAVTAEVVSIAAGTVTIANPQIPNFLHPSLTGATGMRFKFTSLASITGTDAAAVTAAVAAGTWYYVLNRISATQFTFSATQNGAAISVSAGVGAVKRGGYGHLTTGILDVAVDNYDDPDTALGVAANVKNTKTGSPCIFRIQNARTAASTYETQLRLDDYFLVGYDIANNNTNAGFYIAPANKTVSFQMSSAGDVVVGAGGTVATALARLDVRGAVRCTDFKVFSNTGLTGEYNGNPPSVLPTYPSGADDRFFIVMTPPATNIYGSYVRTLDIVASPNNTGSVMRFMTGLANAAPTTKVVIGTNGNVRIGEGDAVPNANAILDLVSTTKAFLPPRVTTTQKGNIASPTAGMVVYDSTLNKLSVYTGAAWETVTSV